MLKPFAGTKDWAWDRWQGGQARVAPDRDLGPELCMCAREGDSRVTMGLLLLLN